MFFISSRRRHTRLQGDWSSDVCSSDLAWDAQRTSANTNALNGKVLKIKPALEGGYTIPAGNLFDERSEERRVGKGFRSRWIVESEDTNNKKVCISVIIRT